MSWTPTFWIRKSDFVSLKDSIKAFDNLGDIWAWEFEVAGHSGVVFESPRTSHLSEELHDLIEQVPHWLLNSESERCENCICWGNKIDLEFL